MNIVRGQYRAGHVDGVAVPATARKPMPPRLAHRDLVAVKAEIDTWRWAGVPFYLRTGKRMADSLAEIVVRFKRCRTRSSRTRTTPPTAW
jgi:glucose-6-phosphate 1-dehydrogenase